MNENIINGITEYLKSLNIGGCSTQLSRRIAETLGEEAIEKILENPGCLTQIEGIGPKRAQAIKEAIEHAHGKSAKNKKHNEMVRSATIFFGSYGISGWILGTIIRKYGDKAVETIQENPYRLTEIEGIGFARADEIAKKMGVEPDSPNRIKAGIIFLLESEADQNGHTCMPYDVLLLRSHFLLGLPNESVKPVLDDMIRHADIDSRNSTTQGEMVALNKYIYAERRIANKMLQLLTTSVIPPSRTSEWGRDGRHQQLVQIDPSIRYTEQQIEAINKAKYHQALILTGGPGTGKTTTLRGIIRELQAQGLVVSLCAPTGKAAKRMTEATGMQAMTIHRLLSYHPENGFRYNYDEPLRTDVVIVDEASMIDTMLMYHLVDAIPLGAKLIIIGDVDQLQSVGAGDVLHDLIKSGTIPVVRLTKIHRQAEDSLIIKNAHNVIEGKPLEIDNSIGSDFYFIERETDEQALGSVISLVWERLSKRYPGMETQILTPLRKNTILGAESLNHELQNVMNPDGRPLDYFGYEFRVGDPIMQIKNDYNHMRFNGETGYIKAAYDFGKKDKQLDILFEDEGDTACYENRDIRNISLNYACTIHKSQGSEYDIVVIPLMPSANIMLQRNLLYTAITRAKKVCILIGSKSSVRAAIQNWHTKLRWTQLCELLTSK